MEKVYTLYIVDVATIDIDRGYCKGEWKSSRLRHGTPITSCANTHLEATKNHLHRRRHDNKQETVGIDQGRTCQEGQSFVVLGLPGIGARGRQAVRHCFPGISFDGRTVTEVHMTDFKFLYKPGPNTRLVKQLDVEAPDLNRALMTFQGYAGHRYPHYKLLKVLDDQHHILYPKPRPLFDLPGDVPEGVSRERLSAEG